MRRRPYVFVANMTATTAAVLERHGIATDQAATIAHAVAVEMCRMYAHTTLYIPAAVDLTHGLDERNRRILAAYGQASPTARPFSTARIAELSQEYGLAESYLYALLKDTQDVVRKEQGLPPMDERQGQLLIGTAV